MNSARQLIKDRSIQLLYREYLLLNIPSDLSEGCPEGWLLILLQTTTLKRKMHNSSRVKKSYGLNKVHVFKAYFDLPSV